MVCKMSDEGTVPALHLSPRFFHFQFSYSISSKYTWTRGHSQLRGCKCQNLEQKQTNLDKLSASFLVFTNMPLEFHQITQKLYTYMMNSRTSCPNRMT